MFVRNFRRCEKCQALFQADNPAASVCPAGGAHQAAASPDYALLRDLPIKFGENNWRQCSQCQGLYLGAGASVCPAGGAHVDAGADFHLLPDWPYNGYGEPGWLGCRNCGELYSPLVDPTGGPCPAGGSHARYPGTYTLIMNLDESALRQVGEECDPDQCPPPNMICSPSSETYYVWRPPQIVNAQAGDLILSPSDGRGTIGGLLKNMQPAEFFDHMGIMVEDFNVLRHSTQEKQRINRKEYYTGSILGAMPAPTDGLRHDQLRYGWPGTITQSIEDAFFVGFSNERNLPFDFYTLNPQVQPIANRDDDPAEFDRRRQFFDPEMPNEGYTITKFQYDPCYRGDLPASLYPDGLIYPMVVKPPPIFEAANLALREMLHRIAMEAQRLQGHYRFYAYTRGDIATGSAWDAPAKGEPEWTGLPAGADWAAGTKATVCSSFVWAAVQQLITAENAHLILEGGLDTPAELTRQQVQQPFIDGLYYYTAAERTQAANWLHEAVVQEVRQTVKEQLDKLKEQGEPWATLAKLSLTVLLSILSGPLAGIAALFGISTAMARDLVTLFSDMPDDVATQLCNSFAKDSEDKDAGDWQNPGDGVAISPDNTMNFWDPPHDLTPLERYFNGLYGYREQAMLALGHWELARRHRLVLSRGMARVHVRALFNGVELAGARVQIGCVSGLTRGHEQPLVLEVPSGLVTLKAGYYLEDPASTQGTWLRAEGAKEFDPGDQYVDLELRPPPPEVRDVAIFAKMDIVHRVLIGSDDWDHPTLAKRLRMEWNEDPNRPQAAHPDEEDLDRHQKYEWTSGDVGGEKVHLALTIHLDHQAIFGDWQVEMKEGDTVTVSEGNPYRVEADQESVFTIDLKDADWPPDRAHVELHIRNARAPV